MPTFVCTDLDCKYLANSEDTTYLSPVNADIYNAVRLYIDSEGIQSFRNRPVTERCIKKEITICIDTVERTFILEELLAVLYDK